MVLLSLCILVAGCRPTGHRWQLQALLDQKDYFKLAAQLKNEPLGDRDRLYFAAFLSNAFNRNEACIAQVDSLLSSDLPDSVKASLCRLQSDSYFKTGNYAKSAQSDRLLLQRYAKGLPKADADDIKNDLLMRNGLKNTPPQQALIKQTTTLPWSRDLLGLIEIPFRCGRQTFNGIFDTRANVSSITRTYAKKLGLRLLDVSYRESSSGTGIQFKTGLGIADSLYIGAILFKNVVFQVMPDSILYIAPAKLQLNVIIGYPVIEQMKEVDIYRDGKMTIPAVPAHSDLHNFALNGLDPVIELKIGKDTLPFNFDSGASSSTFSAAYYDKFKPSVQKNGLKQNIGLGGAGGVEKVDAYILPKVSLSLAGRTVAIDSVSVLTKIMVPGEKLYGNIGQDLTNQFSEFIYNFQYMYVQGR